MPKPYPEEKKREWAEKVRLQQESDQRVSIANWCRQQQINYDTFIYWKKRFKPTAATSINRSSFTELPKAKETGITIEYRNLRIRFDKHFDPFVLKQCLSILVELKC